MESVLTIDDCPSEEFYDKARILEDNNIVAVCFCIGSKLSDNQSIVEDALEDFNSIILGNHTYNHKHASTVDTKELKREIRNTQELIDSLQDYKYKFFRFPYGDKGNNGRSGSHSKYIEIQDFLKQNGYVNPTGTIVDYEWYKRNNHHQDSDWFWTFNARAYEMSTYDAVYQRIQKNDSSNMFGLNNSDSNDIIIYHDVVETHKWFNQFVNDISERINFLNPKNLDIQ